MRTLLLLILATSVFADPTPYSVATLVGTKDDAALVEPVTAALQSDAPLVRATAARIVAVRALASLLPLIRERVSTESDATAAREEIRALALLGADEDLALAAQESARWPATMDNALAVAAARRGGHAAMDAYLSTIRKTRMKNRTEFFRVAFWGRAEVIAASASRLLAAQDENGWRGILDALEESRAVLDRGVMAASLDTKSEDIRAASLWFLVRSYAVDPAQLPDLVKEKILAEHGEASSNREDFGLELLRRMVGGEKKDNPRWVKYLESAEADALIGRAEDAVLQYLTDDEYRVRYNRCELQMRACAMPPKRRALTIKSSPVAPPAFNLPEMLPAGLAEAVMSGAKCKDAWLGLAGVAVDPAGRVRNLVLEKVDATGPCKDAIDTLLRLSFATNTSLQSGVAGPVLLVHGARTPLCLDEPAPRDNAAATLLRAGRDVVPPKVRTRVEPVFPASAREKMGKGRMVIVIIESVISEDGCVRSIRPLLQSPFPELNGAAVLALSQWTFAPGQYEGRPVDVIFNLTVNFRTD